LPDPGAKPTVAVTVLGGAKAIALDIANIAVAASNFFIDIGFLK
jgi:hypothetical protein